MYDEIVKEKIDQVVPDTPEDNVAKSASSWASQSVRKHLMGILCEELAALFQTVWVSDVKNAKSMGNFLIVSEQKKPRIVVTVSKSRVVVRSDARIHLVFNDSRERSESSSSTSSRRKSSSSSISSTTKKRTSLMIVTNAFNSAKASSRALNCCLACTFQLEQGLVSQALDRLSKAERKSSDATESTVFSANVTNIANQSRRVLSAILLPGLVEYVVHSTEKLVVESTQTLGTGTTRTHPMLGFVKLRRNPKINPNHLPTAIPDTISQVLSWNSK